MKKSLAFLSLLLMSFMTFTTYAQYVDLGLPSGTKWKSQNEPGFYKYEEAIEEFGSKLPSWGQLNELIKKCTWTWSGSGYDVQGPNGNAIYFPITGLYDCIEGISWESSYGYYWSSVPRNSEEANFLYFSSRSVGLYFDRRCLGLAVRLVQD